MKIKSKVSKTKTKKSFRIKVTGIRHFTDSLNASKFHHIFIIF